MPIGVTRTLVGLKRRSPVFAAAAAAADDTNRLYLDTPIGTQEGDLMLVGIQSDQGFVSPNPATGWVQLLEIQSTALYMKMADDNEPDEHGFPIQGGTHLNQAGVIASYHGVDQLDPIDALESVSVQSGGALVTAKSVSPSQTESLLVCFFMEGSLQAEPWTAPAGMTGRISAQNVESTVKGQCVFLADEELDEAGPTGIRTATRTLVPNNSNTAMLTGISIALKGSYYY